MPQYNYTAKDTQLQTIDGVIDAESEAAAIYRLSKDGIFPIKIQEIGEAEAAGQTWWGRRVSAKALAMTTRQLADLIGGGLPLLNALTVLSRQVEHPRLRRVVQSLALSVRDGRNFSDALAEHSDVFPSIYINMVRAGEVGGGLESVLNRLADLGELEAEMRSRMINASVYPVIVLCLAVVLVAGMMIWVIPKLSEVFADSGQVLPLPTRIVMAASDALRYGWWAILAAVGGVLWGVSRWYKTSSGRLAIDRFMLTLPGIGGLIRKLNVGRFARNLGVMLHQGVPVLQALDVVAENVHNAVIQDSIRRIRTMVHDGAGIAQAMERTEQFPPFVSNMVAVGEESGQADEALMKVSNAYERQVDQTVKNLTTMLEPLLLIAIGGVVMLVVLSILLPIFQIGLMIE